MAIFLQEHHAIILFCYNEQQPKCSSENILSKITKKIDRKKINILIYIKKYKYLTNFMFSALKC